MLNASYKPQDVTFLLKPIEMPSLDVAVRERQMQRGQLHYSETLVHEKAPSARYQQLFHETVETNGAKFAYHLWLLAMRIAHDKSHSKEITLVSLARAGTPVGVLVCRILKLLGHAHVYHYSISIIRDRGVDHNAIKHIVKHHEQEGICFVDGWTGKGVIGHELRKSIAQFNHHNGTHICANLYVVADICATAHWSATHEDYLLPNAILNATISGLVSRTVVNRQYIGEQDFHGCVVYEHLRAHDVSQWFVEHIFAIIKSEHQDYRLGSKPELSKLYLQELSHNTLRHFQQHYQLKDVNFIKPGIGEATRVLLRRTPKALWIKNHADSSVRHLIYLAEEKNIPWHEDPQLPYGAVAIIEHLD